MSKIPRHVTIIMDGNGRWARKKGLDRLYGHKEGVESVRAVTEFAAEQGIGFLSLFAFSEENWNRPNYEIMGLMELMIDAIAAETPTLMKNNVRFRVVGNLSKLSDTLKAKIGQTEKLSEQNNGLNLIVFLSYSGKWDLLQATGKYAHEVLKAKENNTSAPELTPDYFDTLLSTSGIPDPDLLIRTSGEQRISNYLLWQTAYTEFYFTDVLWPDFRKNDFQKALDHFSERERRFGKTGDQINNLN
ncbi:MAG: di-trans,poly-cis-decaprenylcistransferase [Bacteroidetes bacterium GWF2_40_14]|nr:MAG: di-trans,poly-cis-decaprenylcistransferase [Bacteroidetes bacterium GWF2_40_14]